jgi:hypothetical protein
VTRLLDQQKKLDAEEEEAGEQLEKLQSQLSEALSRLARIRRIKKKAKEKSTELFQRGMAELDKEDGVVPALEAHEHWVVNDLQALGVPNEFDWSSLGLGEDLTDVGPLVCSGDSGGTVAAAAGSSSSA